MPWWKDIPIARTTPIETARLQFDPANPRYSSDRGLPYDNDAQIVTFLYESSDLGELLQSISTSGYVDIEPLIVMGRQERLIVLEGASCTIIAVPAVLASLRRVRRGSGAGLRGLRGDPEGQGVAECRGFWPFGRRPRTGGRAVPFRGGVGGVRRCRWRGVRR